jgi:predicted PhzF superfamily epimerase YddE/YHI9
MVGEMQKQLYVIGGTRILNLEDTPHIEYFDGDVATRILKPISIRMVSRTLQKRFGVSLRQFNQKYQVWSMSAGTPRICVYASNEKEAVEEVRKDEEMLNYLLGTVCGENLVAYPYPSSKQ